MIFFEITSYSEDYDGCRCDPMSAIRESEKVSCVGNKVALCSMCFLASPLTITLSLSVPDSRSFWQIDMHSFCFTPRYILFLDI